MRTPNRHHSVWTWVVLAIFFASTVLPMSCGMVKRSVDGTVFDPVLGAITLCHGAGSRKGEPGDRQGGTRHDCPCCSLHQGSGLAMPAPSLTDALYAVERNVRVVYEATDVRGAGFESGRPPIRGPPLQA